MHSTDVPLSPDERLHELTAILAAGLLRRPQLAGPADMPGEPAASEEPAESSQKTPWLARAPEA